MMGGVLKVRGCANLHQPICAISVSLYANKGVIRDHGKGKPGLLDGLVEG